MWDLLFNTFPCPVGTWKWRWCVGTFVCTRVLFIWETLEPEALLQLSLPRVILPLYSRGKHTSTFNTRHPCAHTSHGERERERERERTGSEKRDCLEMLQVPELPLYSRKTAWMEQHPSKDSTAQQTEHTTCMFTTLRKKSWLPQTSLMDIQLICWESSQGACWAHQRHCH